MPVRSSTIVKAREMAMERRVLGPARLADAFAATRSASTMMVPGSGDICATVVVVGEGPGEEEDRTGFPFVGPAGKLLEEFLHLAGLGYGDVWRTNVLKYRATDARGANRRPLRSELSYGQYLLRRELDIIQPRIVVLCGNTPLKAVKPSADGVLKCRGRPFGGSATGRVYFPVIHPAACLRARQSEEWTIWTKADFRTLGDMVAELDALS